MSALADGFAAVQAWLGRRRGALASGVALYAYWQGERSDFVRFNHGRVRQAGTVARQAVRLRLVDGQRSVVLAQTLGGRAAADAARLDAALAAMTDALRDAHDDPYLLLDTEAGNSRFVEDARLPAPADLVPVVERAVRQAAGADLVGFYMAGPMACGLLSSLGHCHYHESASWSFDFSLYSPLPALRDKAVKSSVAGVDWDEAALVDAVAAAARQVPILARPARRLAPGSYRALLSPQAGADLLAMFAWGGFSARELATGQSPLARLRDGRVRLDPRLQVREAPAEARVPRFQDSGFLRPDSLPLIEGGRFGQPLVSARSAREFGMAGNGAGDAEMPEAMRMSPGDLDPAAAWQALGTGLSVGNLWYLNFSDRDACRVTGMTRFATLWVEDGEPVAPVEPMRFDDSLFDLFGERLEALGADSVWLPDTSSDDWRGFGGCSAPMLLLGAMSFTL
ncbi:MAG: metallopeptidase TldD-related protein [Burkholderiaceae bacterium]